MFNRKQNGTPRNWKYVNEQEIETIYLQCKEKIHEIAMVVKAGGNSQYQIEDGLGEEEFKKIMSKLNEDIEDEYQEALRKHVLH